MSIRQPNTLERPWHVTGIGETMGAFVPGRPPTSWERTYIGAESNTLVALARLGFRVRWISRLGDDELGAFVRTSIASAGVVPVITLDPQRLTGCAVKESMNGTTNVRYYRSDSAASSMEVGDLPDLGDTDWLHITGITPALSDSCRELTMHVAREAHRLGARLSLDVNVRPALWDSVDRCRSTLLELCRWADICFVGLEEADILVGSRSAHTVRDRLDLEPTQSLVLKQGSRGATLLAGGDEWTEPAFAAPVVDVVGAGDAFAAGVLAGTMRGLPPATQLKLGNYLASLVIQSFEDVLPPTTWDSATRALGSSETLESRQHHEGSQR